jgi:hypothetical protein
VTAPAGAVHRITAESLDLAWWPLDALPAPLGASVERLVARLRYRP